MKYFTENEFRGWYDKIDPDLLKMIDDFREKWGASVTVSPAPGAIGRTNGNGFHNYIKHGSIKAIDLFPKGMDGPDDYRRAVECATEAGALGIGVYPDWRPTPGVHLDIGVRPGRAVGNPATWSAFKINGEQEYFGLERAYEDG